MINQVTRDRINSLSEKYRKLAIKHKEAIKDSKPFDWGSETKKGNKRVVSKKING